MILSITTKKILFWWVGDIWNHLRTEVTTKSVNKNLWSHYIYQIGATISKKSWIRNLCIQKFIVVNHWLSQSILSKISCDGLGTCELISVQKLQPNQWKNSKFTIYIKLGLFCQNSPWLRNLCIQIMIVVNHWFL